MIAPHFDLVLCEGDRHAMQEARRAPFVLDREAALKLIADASFLVDAAIRRRPVFSGAPFRLPGHQEPLDSATLIGR